MREARDPFTPRIVVGSGLAYTSGFPMSIEGSAPSVLNVNAQSFLFNPAQRQFVKAARIDWSASTLEGDGKPLVDKIRAYARAGLEQYLCAFPKDHAAEMIERSRELLIPAFA